MMSTGCSGACFQAPGGESAGHSLQALTHRPQACHSAGCQLPHHPRPQPGFAGSGGGVKSIRILKQALGHPELFLEAAKRDMRKKLSFYFLKLPLLSHPKATLLSLAVKSK